MLYVMQYGGSLYCNDILYTAAVNVHSEIQGARDLQSRAEYPATRRHASVVRDVLASCRECGIHKSRWHRGYMFIIIRPWQIYKYKSARDFLRVK